MFAGMVIAAHISFPGISESPLLASLILSAEKHATDRFVIFTPKDLKLTQENISCIQNSPVGRNVIFQQYWYRFSLPALLKKAGADVFISDTGILSPKTSVPQFLYFRDHDFEYRTGIFFKKNFSRSLAQAKKIFLSEDFIGLLLTNKHTARTEKLKTVYYGLPAEKENPASAEMIKEKFTGGGDYFLFPADISSAGFGVTLLKAFSQLKKRQKSSMKLVMLLNDIDSEDLIPDFKNYKYRDDVLMISAKEKNADMLIAHACAVIWLSIYTVINEVLPALRDGVPVIAEENETNKSLFGNAALYTVVSGDALSEKMQLLYKDEFIRPAHAATAATMLKKYNSREAADALYAGITDHKNG